MKVDFSFLRTPVFKEMLSYGGWVILAGASFTLIQHIEKVMLPAYMGGLGTTAIFDINSRMAIMISIPRNVIAAIAAPILAQAGIEMTAKIFRIFIKNPLSTSSSSAVYSSC